MLVVGAVEIKDGGLGPGRIRLSQVPDYSAASLHAFLATNLGRGATAKTDGWSGYPGAAGVTHDPHVVGKIAAHIVLPWRDAHRCGFTVDGTAHHRYFFPPKGEGPQVINWGRSAALDHRPNRHFGVSLCLDIR
jgi:hypothetical protein